MTIIKLSGLKSAHNSGTKTMNRTMSWCRSCLV